MSYPAKTIFIFGCYLLPLGLFLLTVPNLVLGLFHMPLTSEVWIRVVGMLVLFLGAYYLVAAKAEIRLFMVWSARLRFTVILFFACFVLARIAPPLLLLFGAADLAGAVWTWSALRKESSNHPSHAA